MSVTSFGSLFEFIRNGLNVKQDKLSGGLPISRIETIWNSTIDLDRVGYAGLRENECNEWLLAPGDILFSHINSVDQVGKCAVYDGTPEKLIHGMNLLCLRCNSELILPAYAKHLIRSEQFRGRISRFINKAVNQASISIGNLKSVEVTVPTLAEQQRIATILDNSDSLRRKRQESIRLVDEFLRALFYERFAAKPRLSVLTDYCDFLSGFAFKSDQYIEPRDGVRLLRGINVGIDRFEWGDSAGYPLNAVSDLTRYRLEAGDVVLAMDRPWISSGLKCAAVDERVAGSYLVQRVARLRPKQQGMSAFIMNCLRGDDFKSHCRITETTIPHISPKDFATFPVPTATEAELRSFADIAKRIQHVASMAEQAAISSDELTSSLQATMFNLH